MRVNNKSEVSDGTMSKDMSLSKDAMSTTKRKFNRATKAMLAQKTLQELYERQREEEEKITPGKKTLSRQERNEAMALLNSRLNAIHKKMEAKQKNPGNKTMQDTTIKEE